VTAYRQCPHPDQVPHPAPHGHVECPFCESTIACVIYTFPPLINSESMTLWQVPPAIESLCEEHMGVHVEEMVACVSS
jgi:hypothetical protein